MKNKRLLLIGGVAGITLFTIVGCGSQANVAPRNKTTAESSMNNTPSNTEKRNATNIVSQPSSSTQSQIPNLTSIYMLNSKTGWATGHNSVWYTKDGGVSWAQVTPKGLRASSNFQMKVYGFEDKNAWVAASDTSSVSNPLFIYHTSDGGQS